MNQTERWWAVDEVRWCPVLLLRGAQSEALSPVTAAEMVRRFRDCRLAEIASGAHDLGVRQPEAVADEVLGFLR